MNVILVGQLRQHYFWTCSYEFQAAEISEELCVFSRITAVCACVHSQGGNSTSSVILVGKMWFTSYLWKEKLNQNIFLLLKQLGCFSNFVIQYSCHFLKFNKYLSTFFCFLSLHTLVIQTQLWAELIPKCSTLSFHCCC